MRWGAEWIARHRRLALVVAWLVGTGILAAVARTVDWRRAVDVMATIRPGWAAFAILANAAILLAWAVFWRALRPRDETPISFGRMFEITATASALMNTLPFGGGHASSVVLLMRRGETTQRGALATLALDQLGEGIAKVTVFLLASWLVPLPSWMRAAITTATLVVGGWFLVLVVASRWARELRLVQRGRAVGALVAVLATKAAEAVAIAAVQHAFGVHVGIAGTMLVLSAVILGSMVPLSPGNLGTYEAGAFFAYRFLGVAPEQAMGLALVQHLCFMLPSVGVGYLILSAHTVSRSAIASR